ncbi:hypothetical protein QBC47DRAFT_33470 [Echria macrotheca]|uniref:Uncharacterized protein n=1 Tax=Echria macrotheca TaxID=438768 RepID=A0AAJ0B985_9PEZI|nr:hypothetical protein QBC47DRAFT_33470 [Echria macrotheca]
METQIATPSNHETKPVQLRSSAPHAVEINWTQPVIFRPNDAVNHPRSWLEKREKLEAHVLYHAAKPSHHLHEPLPTSMRSTTEAQHYLRHHIVPVLVGVSSNLSRLQRAHFCDETINALVMERGRHQVARLTDLSISFIRRFVARSLEFIDGDEIRDHGWSTSFLRYCVDTLGWFGLRPHSLQDFSHSHARTSSSGSHGNKRQWSHGTVNLALVHALRALAYTLDIAVVSFAGAHLEHFDDVYFARPHERHGIYQIPCDADSKSSVMIFRRHFECLAGFLGDHPAWVFEVHERGHVIDLSRNLYLRASPEELANVWGPVWRSEDLSPQGRTRFLLSRGLIVGWRHSSNDPPLLPGEYFCHWTDDPTEAASSSPCLPRYINIPYLFIGAHSHPRPH